MPVYINNGKSYNIPDELAEKFENENPGASVKVSGGGKNLTIPLSKKGEFFSVYQDASYRNLDSVAPSTKENTQTQTPIAQYDEFDNEWNTQRSESTNVNAKPVGQVLPNVPDGWQQDSRYQLDENGKVRPLNILETETSIDEDGNKVSKPKLVKSQDGTDVYRNLLTGEEYNPMDAAASGMVEQNKMNIPQSEKKRNDPSLIETIGKSLGAGFTRLGAGMIDAMQQLSSGMIVEVGNGEYMRMPSYDETINDKSNAMTKASDVMHETADRMSAEAQPYGGQKGFLDLLWDGEIGKAAQKGVATAGESLPMTLSAFNPYTMVLNAISMAGGNYREEAIENPDVPAWKRATYAIGQAAIEQAVEKYADPVFKYIGGTKVLGRASKDASKEIVDNVTKDATETLAKRIYHGLGGLMKDAAGEGTEEVITNFGNDILGEALDLLDGDKDYGIRAQWEKLKKENPDASLKDFAKAKAKENVESFIGGAMAGAYTSGTAQLSAKALEYTLGGAPRQNTNMDPVSMDVAQSYDEGMNFEDPNDKNNAKNMLDYQRNRLQNSSIRGVIADALDGKTDAEPLSVLINMIDSGAYTDEEKQLALDFLNAKATYNGMIERVKDNIDEQIHESDITIDARVNRNGSNAGRIVGGTMKLDDRKVYVIDGDVKMFDDGSMVDNANSSESVLVMDAETGKLEFVSPNDILSVDAPIDAEQEKEAARNAIRESVIEEQTAIIDGILPFNPGDEYSLKDEQGNSFTAKVVQSNEDGTVLVSLNGGEPKIMAKEMLQGMSDAENLSRLAEYQAGKTLKETEDQFENGQQPTTAVDGTEDVSATEQPNTVATEQQNVDGNPVDEQIDTVEEENGGVEPMPMIGNGDNAEPDFMAVAPERGYKYLYEESGLSQEDVSTFVQNNVNEAEKALTKIDGKKPNIGTSISKYNKDMAEWNNSRDAINRKLEYWKKMQSLRNAELQQRAEEQRKKDAEAHDQAVEDLKQYDAEQKRKAEEQAAIGANAVAPGIRAKWDAATKVEGLEDSIVLPNGETINGRYMLVESGAASASHDANNGFTKTEGFPIDENGGSVNDRDYERDKDAQRTTREIANNYDQRAVQTPVVVSGDGVVLSGNGRTMAGELAAAQNTDGAYIDYVRDHAGKWGFTSEQVSGMQHPRVVFVPADNMPYTADTFAKFNAQEMKSQSKTEQAVKMGKVVDDATFGRITKIIGEFDTIGDFYADNNATAEVIGELQKAGVVSSAQMAEMFDGDGISNAGKDLIENVLIGKAFESNPDALRQLTEFKSLRQSVMTALSAITDNAKLGEDFSLIEDLAQAIDLAYKARIEGGYNAGDRVSGYARQMNLGFYGEEMTVADVNNIMLLILADAINDSKVSLLKHTIRLWNERAQDAANGQLDLFTGEVPSRDSIINEVKELFKYDSRNEKGPDQTTNADRGSKGSKENGEEVKPVGNSAFGEIFTQFKGNVKAAIAFLLERKQGNAVAALHHPEVGDIDLWYGNDKAGLKKISKKHPEVLDNLQEIIDGMRVVSRTDNRIKLESDTHFAVVSKDWLGEEKDNWLLTAYEKKKKGSSDGTMDIGSEPGQGKQNGTAPLQTPLENEESSSRGKGTNNSATEQENTTENVEVSNVSAEKEGGVDKSKAPWYGTIDDAPATDGLLKSYREELFEEGQSAYSSAYQKYVPMAQFGVEEVKTEPTYEEFVKEYTDRVGDYSAKKVEKYLPAFYEYFKNKLSEATKKNSKKNEPQSTAAEETKTGKDSAKKQPNTVASEKPNKVADEKIEDVGEKIGGARKDATLNYAKKIDLEATVPSKIFPKPNFASMEKAGVPHETLVKLKAYYTAFSITNKNKRKRNENQRILSARFYASVARDMLLRDVDVFNESADGIVLTDYGKQHLELLVSCVDALDKKGMQDFFDLDISDVDISIGEFKEYENGAYQTKDGKRWVGTYNYGRTNNMAAVGYKLFALDDIEGLAEEYCKQVEVAHSKNVQNEIKMHVYRMSSGKCYISAKVKGISDEIKLKDDFASSKEAFDYIRENGDALRTEARAKADEMKQNKKNGGGTRKPSNDDIERMLRNIVHGTRIGKDYRNGKDVSAEDFMNEFGFRGVEFGNWATQKERQDHLNACYDALMDMADLIGISPKAISLGGKLAMAFGSRGHSSALAHYEPAKHVINLTKEHGAGCVAHEWFHAIDNYFGGGVFGLRMKSAVEGNSRDNLRSEMQKIFAEIGRALNSSDMKVRSMKLGNGDYWASTLEMAARAFESYVNERLMERGQKNQYLSDHVPGEAVQYEDLAKNDPYPTAEEGKKFGEIFDRLFDTVQEEVGDDGNVNMFQIADVEPYTENNTEAEQLATEAVMTLLNETAGLDVVMNTQEEGQLARQNANAEFMAGIVKAKINALNDASRKILSWLKNNTHNKSFKLELPSSSNRLAEKRIGHKIESHVINANEIIHARKQHGLQGKNNSENSIPLRDEDFALCPYIMASPTRIESGTPQKTGQKSIRYVKEISNGTIVCVEVEGAIEETHMANITMWAEKSPSYTNAMVAGKTASYNTSETAIISSEDAAKIRKDAETAIENDVKSANSADFMTVWHGSAAIFDQFDGAFMGTGEGSQVYGDGHYVTDVEGTGRMYATISTENRQRSNTPIVFWKGERIDFSGVNPLRMAYDVVDSARTIAEARHNAERYAGMAEEPDMQQKWNAVLDILKRSTKADFKKEPVKGNRQLYEIEIPDDNGKNYLDWNREYSRTELEEIGVKLNAIGNPKFDYGRYQEILDMYFDEDGNPQQYRVFTGEQLYRSLATNLAGGMDMDKRGASEMLSEAGIVGVKVPTGNRKGGDGRGMNYVIFNDADLNIKNRIEFLENNGTVYGWSAGNRIHLTPEGINPNTPIHEYTHLWAKAVQKNAPKLWDNVKTLLKGTPILDEVVNDPAYQGLTNDDEIASEALSRMSGRKNAERMVRMAEQMIEDSKKDGTFAEAKARDMIYRMRDALKKFWQWVGKNLFDIEKFGSVEEVTDRVLYDLVNKTDLQLSENGDSATEFQKSNDSAEFSAGTEAGNNANGRTGAEQDLESVNKKFNDELDDFNNLESGHRFELGMPSAKLIAAGFDNLPISMRASIVNKKKNDPYHKFEATDLKDLVLALQKPIAVFRYTKDNVRNVIVDIQKNGKNFLVGITLNYKPTGSELEINSVSGLFPKDNHEWIKWIQDGKAVAIYEKGKVQNLISSLRINPAEAERIGLNLEDAAKIVEDFKNPKLSNKKVQESASNSTKSAENDIRYRQMDEFEDGQELMIETDKYDFTSPYTVEGLTLAPEPNVAKLLTSFREKYQKYCAMLNEDGTAIIVRPWKVLLSGIRKKESASSKRKRAEYAERAAKIVTEQVMEQAKKLGLNVEVKTDTEGLKGRRARSKGWYDVTTGKIVIVLPNHTDGTDIMRTLMHEAVGHYGLRKLFGKDFDAVLDNIYANSNPSIRRHIADLAARNGWNFRVATEEYMAQIAEDIDYESKSDSVIQSWWNYVSSRIIEFINGKLREVGFVLPFTVNDNDLRLMMWRSYENIANANKHGIFRAAEVEAMKQKTGIGYASDEELERADAAVADDSDPDDDPNGGGIRFRDGDDVSVDDTADTEAEVEAPMTLEESIIHGLSQLAERNRDNVQLRMDAVNAIENKLQKIRRAMSAQKTYDQYTVNEIAGLARVLIKDGYFDSITSREIMKMLSLIKGATGKEDITKSADSLYDMMIENQLRKATALLNTITNIKAGKVNAQGVNVQGQLDARGQILMNAYKEAVKNRDEQSIMERMAEVDELMTNPDDAIAQNAAIEKEALELALQYHQTINESKREEASLKDDLKDAKAAHKAGEMGTESYKELVQSIYEALRQNRLERIEAMNSLSARLSGTMRGSIDAAKDFNEREKERVRNIHHFANSDMEGVPATAHRVENWKQRLANNALLRFFFNPLSTFDQMLRMIGRKSANGEGYLWNHFMRGFIDARRKEYSAYKKDCKILDAKVSEVFGKKMLWSDLYSVERSMPKAEVSFWDNGKRRTEELSQGNLLYIYMVNKMADGRMKLRRMGITNVDVDDIKSALDPRLIELADWLQNEFLVQKRNDYNKVHMRMFGAPMDAIENYFPLRILGDARQEKVDVSEADIERDLPSVLTKSIIKRKRNTIPLDIMNADAFSVVIEHVQDMEKWAAFAEWRKDLNTLLSYKTFKNKLKNMSSIYGGGNKLWKNFMVQSSLAAGTYKPKVAMDSVDSALVNVAKGVTAAKISFRIYTALKQMLSSPAFIAEANSVNLAKSMATPWVSWNWAMKNLPTFDERWESRQAGDSRLMPTDADWKFWKNKLVETLGRWGMSPNAFVDAMTISIGAKAIYDTKLNQYLKDGYTQEVADKKAKQDAAVLFNQTQQSSENAFMSKIQVDRTLAAVSLSVFRNSSFAYTRQLVDAVRELKREMTPGYRKTSVEFMTKQMERDGLTHEQAEQAANRRYNREITRNVTRVALFGFIMQFAWNLGPYLPYLLFGGDDDDKEKMFDDAAMHAMVGGVEGLSAGSILSEVINMKIQGEDFKNYDFNLLPLVSDVMNILKKYDSDKVSAINDITNLVIQSGIGVNPQTIEDAVVAIMDACDNDAHTSREATILILRLLQAPQGQIDKLYADELGMRGEDATKLSVPQLAERYAKYKKNRGAALTEWAYDDESERAVEDKYIKRFENLAKEKFNSTGIIQLDEAYDKYVEQFEPFKKRLSNINKLENKDPDLFDEKMNELEDTKDYSLYEEFESFKSDIDNLINQAISEEDPEERELILEEVLNLKRDAVETLDAMQ